MTPPEARLWVNVRRNAFGVAVRRQHPIGPYILDFYCAPARLAIEIDGEGHGQPAQRRHDQRRDAHLSKQGIRVLRIRAVDVRDELDAVLEHIASEIAERIG